MIFLLLCRYFKSGIIFEAGVIWYDNYGKFTVLLYNYTHLCMCV